MISNIPSPYSPSIAPQVSVTRASVGQESADLKATVFRPTEQLAANVRAQTRRDPDDRPSIDAEKGRLYSRESLKADMEARVVESDATEETEGREQPLRETLEEDRSPEADAPKGIESEEERQAKEDAAQQERAEQQKELAKYQAEQLALDQRRAREQAIDEQNQRNLDLARQLFQISAYKPSVSAGIFLDKTV